MSLIRIIPKLDIKNGLLIKGINLDGLRILGDPNQFALSYYKNYADEIVYLDSVATLYGTNNLLKFIKLTAKNIFIPLVVGGGIKTLRGIEEVLENGADRIALNSAVVEDIKFLNRSAKLFGSSTITMLVETIKFDGKYFISTSSGRDLVNINPFDWVKKLEDNGAGEIFLTSVNHEGLKRGFDLKLTERISRILSIPLIAHGGAGSFKDVYDVINKCGVSAVAIGSLFHYDTANIMGLNKNINLGNTEFLRTVNKSKFKNNLILLKKYLKQKKLNVRI